MRCPSLFPRLAVIAAACVLSINGTAAASSAQAAQAVSPLSSHGTALIEARCPTFSWTSVNGSEGYELVVFRVATDTGEKGSDSRPALTVRLPAAANSWTPNLDQCLLRGETYAWSIRPLARPLAQSWSTPSFFAIADERGMPPTSMSATSGRSEAVAAALAVASTHPTPSNSAPDLSASPAAKAANNFAVDGNGNVAATSFAGDGAGLTGVRAVTATALTPEPPNCGAGFAPTGIFAQGNAEGCFDVATQAELDTHKTSGDHDSRYLRLSGGTITGATNFSNTVNFNNDVTYASSRFVTINGVLKFKCPFTTAGQLTRVGSW